MSNQFEKFTSHDGLNLSVKIQDNAKSEKILLLHGFNDTKETFLFIEDFLGKHFDLVSFDFRGHGDSDWKTKGLYNYADSLLDIHSIAEKYFDQPFTILGHSMGAGLGARYSGIFPEKVKKLICLEGFSGVIPWAKEREKIRGWLENMHGKSNRIATNVKQKQMNTIEDAAGRLSLIYSKLEKAKIEKLVVNLVRRTEDGVFVWKNDPGLKSSAPIPFPPELSRATWANIDSPVLIVFGKDTHLKSANMKEVLSHFRNCEYIEIEGAGHNIHHDKPEILTEVIEDFLHRN